MTGTAGHVEERVRSTRPDLSTAEGCLGEVNRMVHQMQELGLGARKE